MHSDKTRFEYDVNRKKVLRSNAISKLEGPALATLTARGMCTRLAFPLVENSKANIVQPKRALTVASGNKH